ncbi:thiamine pyrophosphate-dependent dehydrogenase E1 component subunit alpha [Nocardioides agariphilus]|uniref:Thiamine pyrophosphate-dependent dehydrogenase E1 component subunit alpha n=1 Tax=Nocardioides agariphilus TaxID=433664 RepID=A0A930YJJ4_9ACTN|nr:thiamine pyrophosphate-dependent dehydrogenase E1 component subunit alpha [Nocardioides agariphilus]
MTTTAERRIGVLRTMVRARAFEEGLGEEFAKQREHAKAAFGGRNSAFEDYNAEFHIPIQGNIELAIGQEATPAAMCAWLTPDDYAAGTHRSHALAIAKGVPIDRMLAEIYGRATGLAGGRGGDFMLNDPDSGFENSAIMAQLTAVALGHAFAHQRQRTGGVATVFIGDGASNQGVVHESMNLAALWKLPVVFVIEDNGYAISTRRKSSSAVEDLSARALPYGMPGSTTEDREVDRLISTAGEAVARARRGDGPSLLVSRTHRLRGAFEGDSQAYRPDGELEDEEASDALPAYGRLLVEEGLVDDSWIRDIRAGAEADFARALDFAESSPYPEPETAREGLFA